MDVNAGGFGNTKTKEDREKFEKWLRRLNNEPSAQLLQILRKAHYNQGVRPTLYTINQLIKHSGQFKGLFEGFGAMTLISYIHNMHNPSLTEKDIDIIMNQWDLYIPRKNVFETNNVLLIRLAKEAGMGDMDMQTKDCSICLEPLGWYESFLDCGHVYHFDCIYPLFEKECPICRQHISSISMS